MRVIRSLILSFLILLVSIGQIQSQETSPEVADTLTMKGLLSRIRVNPCYDYNFNGMKLIPEMYERDQLDSIRSVINWLTDSCEVGDRLYRTELLLDLYEGKFREGQIDPDIIDQLIDFRKRQEHVMAWGYGWGYSESKGVEMTRDYDRFLLSLAEDATSRYNEGSIGRFFCLYYQGEFDLALDQLKSERYAGTRLQRQYYNTVDELLRRREHRSYYAINAGIWSPRGGLGILGDHAITGFSYGGKRSRIEFDLTFDLRYLDAENYYTVVENGVADSTDHFFGGYIGLNAAYELTRSSQFSTLLLAGVGVEGFDTTEDPNGDTKDSRNSLWSATGNGGLGFRYYFSKYQTWFITAWARYHVVGYDSNGGSDLSGNAVSFGITIGAFSFGEANERLRALNYFD